MARFMQQKSEELAKMNRKLQTKLAELEARLAAQQSENTALKAGWSAAAAKTQALEAAAKQAEDEITSTRSEHTVRITELTERSTAAADQNRQLLETIAELEAIVSSVHAATAKYSRREVSTRLEQQCTMVSEKRHAYQPYSAESQSQPM